jgi:hypothetical protein
MAGFQALLAAGQSIEALLTRRFGELAPGAGLTAKLANTHELKTMETNQNVLIQKPAVSLFPYRVSVDKETRPGWSSVASRDGVPRIPLRLHFLVGAFADTVEEELYWLGLTARVLESESILTGPLLLPAKHPSLSEVNPWTAGDAVQVVTDDVAMDSMSEAFQALATDYRLQMPYVARVIVLDGATETVAEPVATVAGRVEERHP